MNIDVVIIGINVADTLERCLRSVQAAHCDLHTLSLTYVDGGSSDASIAIARSFPGVTVLNLPRLDPTPGAGRNLGWRSGSAPLVQFLDADTEIDPEWFTRALAALQEGVGAVVGDRYERQPGASVYNWIADREWNPPAGSVEAFGGDVLVRREALEQTGGYDEDLVGGEDPELSQRIRQSGWSIQKIAAPMTTHDIAMHSFAAYWRRAFRTGYGFAAVTARHGYGRNHFWASEIKRIVVRGGGGVFGLVAALSLIGVAPLGSLFLALAAGFLLSYPRLCSVGKFQRELRMNPFQARVYATHCAAVILPEFFGLLRFFLGQAANRPLRNRRHSPRRRRPIFAGIATLFTLSACVSPDPGIHRLEEIPPGSEAAQVVEEAGLETAGARQAIDYASVEEVQAFSESVPEEYLMGPGDIMSILVRGRPDASLEQITVAPDGKISLPILGILNIEGMTIPELTEIVRDDLSRLYENPDVIVQIHEYHNNKVYVLGRVAHPGLVRFGGTGTLLEALSLAGGLPTVAEEAFLTRAVIFRGSDTVIWVDLTEILERGNMSMNPRLLNNDLVYIPESDDELVYVMGEVRTPGAIRLKSQLTVLDAVMFSGGPTRDAKLTNIYLLRQKNGRGYVQQVDFTDILEQADRGRDYLLEDGDIVYVSTKAIEEINYAIRKVTPAIFWLPLGK